VIFDDSLLPDPEQLAIYQTIDPTTITWLKERAEIEQSYRHTENSSIRKRKYRLDLMKTSFEGIGLIFAFIVILAVMYISWDLVKSNYVLEGTIFSGTTIAILISLLVKSKISKSKPKTEE